MVQQYNRVARRHSMYSGLATLDSSLLVWLRLCEVSCGAVFCLITTVAVFVVRIVLSSYHRFWFDLPRLGFLRIYKKCIPGTAAVLVYNTPK